MKISTGPVALARPGWGFEDGRTYGFVADCGRPDALIAQVLAGAAVSGARTLMLLPGMREEDPVWACLVQLMSGGDRRAMAQALGSVPLSVHTAGSGKERLAGAHLVYAPGLQPRELKALRVQSGAPFLIMQEEGADEKIIVGGDIIALDGEGIEIPVAFDQRGPMYLPAR